MSAEEVKKCLKKSPKIKKKIRKQNSHRRRGQKYLLEEKTRKAHEKNRLSLIDALANAITLEIPPILIENELEKMVAEMKNDITVMGLKFEDYLKHLKKTEADLKKIGKRARERDIVTALALTEIGVKENLKASEKELKPHLKTLTLEHQDADLARLRAYLKRPRQ